MIRTLVFPLIAAGVFFAGASLRADTYVVVSAPAVAKKQTIPMGDLREIFLGRKLFWEDNQRIYSFCSNLAAPPVVQFLHDVLEMAPDQYSSYWRRKLFSGKGFPPKEFSDDIQALSYVRANPTSIGVLASRPSSGDAAGIAVFRVDVAASRLVREGAL